MNTKTFKFGMVIAVSLGTVQFCIAGEPLQMTSAEKAVLMTQPELQQNLKDWADRFVTAAERMKASRAVNLQRLRDQVADLHNYVDSSNPLAQEYTQKIQAFRTELTRTGFSRALNEVRQFQADLR